MPTVPYSHFLNLPAEIRTEIYGLFFEPLVQHAKRKAQFVCEDARRAPHTSVVATSVSDDQNSSRSISEQHSVEVKEFLQLLLVCRLIHQEALPICYNNVTFYVRKPLDFANGFLCSVGQYKLSQIRHIEMRLEGIPVGVDGWSLSAPKPSYWSHHQVRTLFKSYPELECLDTLVIKIEKFANRKLARWAGSLTTYPEYQFWRIESAWSQNKDTNAMKLEVSHLDLVKDSQNFNLAFTAIDDDQINEKDKRFLRTADGRHCCQIDMKRVFQITLWKDSGEARMPC